MNMNMLKGNIIDSNKGLGSALSFGIIRIQHTARPITIGLFHLLWSDINCPPDGSIHGEVLVQDVFYLS